MRKMKMRCVRCGRTLEVFVEENEIVDVAEVLSEGIAGCQHDYDFI